MRKSLLSILFLLASILIYAQVGILNPKTGKISPVNIKNLAVAKLVSANYDRPDEKLSKTQIAALNKPATVKVYSTEQVTFQYREPSFFNRMMLHSKAKQMADQGLIENSISGKLNYVLNEIITKPGSYITPSLFRQQSNLTSTSTGSGMFFTPDGYILTNAHVVEFNELNTKRMAIAQVAQQLINSEMQKHLEAFPAPIDDQTKAMAENAMFGEMIKFIEILNHQAKYEIRTGLSIDHPQHVLPAQLITMGSAIPGKDVAILKAETVNAPCVTFAPAEELEIGEDLYLLGYPSAVYNNAIFDPNVLEEPTFTTGSVSSWQKIRGGDWKAVGFDGNSAKGNSGGPAFNSYGEVVGMLTFGSLDLSGSELKQGYNYIVPTEVMAEFVRSKQIKPRLSSHDSLYRSGLHNYFDEEYRKSTAEFKLLKAWNPKWSYLDDLLDRSNAKALQMPKEENVKEKGSRIWGYLQEVGIKWYHILAFVVVVGGGLIRIFR